MTRQLKTICVLIRKQNSGFLTFFEQKYSICDQEIRVLVIAPLLTGIIEWDKSIRLFVPEFHCLDNGDKKICAVLLTG